MITVSIIGVDPFMVRQISKAMTSKIAALYEVQIDDVNFYAPECLYIHNGVEQNTWNVLVKVNAPLKVKVLEEKAVRVIREYMLDACVNLAIEFYYYSQDNRYEFINPTHPRFMTEENTVDFIEDDEVIEEDYEDEESGEEPYLGNIFEDFDKKMG